MDDTAMYRRATRTCAILVAAALCGCANHVGTTAASFLRNARDSPDPNIRHVAYQKLGIPSSYDRDEQKAQAVEVMAAALGSNREPMASRAAICRALGQLGRPEARPALIKACDDDEPVVRAEACRALGRVALPDDAPTLSRHMISDTDNDCRIAAIEGLGAMRAGDPQVALLLVDGMEHDDPAVRLASVRALRSITGQDLGTSPEPWRKLAQAQIDREATAKK